MNEQEFLQLLQATATKGGATYNLKTQNASKQARTILQATQYSILAKQHIANNIVQAYNNNKAFKMKLDEVMKQNGITIIA